MGELFLGTIRIGVGIGTSADPSTNKTYYGLKNYVDSSFVSAVAEGNANGKIAVTKNGTTTQISVHGLGTAAYTASTAYATAAQGTKADSAIQGVDSSDSDAISFTTDSNKVAYAEIHLDGTGAIPLAVVPGNGISASLNSSYVDGSLSTSATGKLLTKGAADGYYATTAQGSKADSAIQTITSGDATALTATKSGTTYTITPNTGAVSDNNGKLTTAAQVKTYVDAQISGLGHAMRYVGDSSTVPTTAGATVQDLPSGFTWKVGDVVTCSATGYTGREYLLFQGGTNIAANWRELGDESTYALKTTTISGTNGLTVTAGGTLGQNTTLGIATTVVDGDTTTISSSNKILTQGSTYIKSVSGDNAISVTTTSKAASISLSLDSTSGQLDFTKGTNGLYASLKSSYVEGTLSTTNKLITVSYGDGRYGRLASANTWSGANTFSGNIVASGASVDLDPSTSISISANGSNVINGDGGDVTVGDPTTGLTLTGGTITSGLITCSTAPSTGNHLTNRTYVDSAITTALTWASI